MLAAVNDTVPHTPTDTSDEVWWTSFALIAFACLVLALPAVWYVPAYTYTYVRQPVVTVAKAGAQGEKRPLLVLPLSTRHP